MTGKLGTANSELGNIVLGGADGVINDVIANNAIIFTQTITRTVDLNPSNTISFASSLIRATILNTTNSLTLTLNQDATFNYSLLKSRSNSLTFSQSLAREVIFDRSLTSTLSLTQSAVTENELNLSPSNTINFSSLAVGIKEVLADADNSLTLTNTAVGVLTKFISQTLTFSQDTVVNTVLNRTLNTNFISFQSVTTENELNPSASNTINYSNTAIGYHSKDANNEITFTQDVDVTVSMPVGDIVTFTQTVLPNYTKSISVTSTFKPKNILVKALSSTYKANNIYAPNQEVRKTKVITLNATNSLVLTNEGAKGLELLNPNNTLTLTQTVTKIPIKYITATNNLALTQSVSRPVVFNFDITQSFTFIDGFNKIVNLGPTHTIHIPTVIVAVSRKYNLLKSPSRVITLPQANFADSYENKSQLTVRRSMNGLVYTTVKRSDLEHIRLAFQLERNKAYELDSFIKEFKDDLLTLEIWRGEIYTGYITNNPFEFDFGTFNERTDVTVEFEGVRLV